MSSHSNVSKLVTAFHPNQFTGTIHILESIGTIYRKTINRIAQQRGMLRTINHIQTVCRIQIADIRYHLFIQFKRRRILMMVIIAHRRMSFRTIKPSPLSNHRIPVPNIVAHPHQRTALQRLLRIAPTHAISVIKQSNPIDKNPNVTTGCVRGGTRIFHWLQGYFENRILILRQTGIAIQKRTRYVRWDSRSCHIHPIR